MSSDKHLSLEERLRRSLGLQGGQLPQAQPTRQLPAMRPMAPADQAFRNRDLHQGYWNGYEVPVPVTEDRSTNDTLLIIPTEQSEPLGTPPQIPAWAVGTCPMWNCMPFWGRPFEQNVTACIPTWEQDYVMGTIEVGEMEMLILRTLSYHVITGLSQYDVFEVALLRNSEERIRIEDMIIDPTTGNPSDRYVFAGDVTPMPVRDHVDRNQRLVIKAKARGQVTFSGLSNHAPGDPLNPNAHIRVTVSGWIAPLRTDSDGGPRPTDFGNALFVHLDQHRKWYGA